jgi:hypothetical protein
MLFSVARSNSQAPPRHMLLSSSKFDPFHTHAGHFQNQLEKYYYSIQMREITNIDWR